MTPLAATVTRRHAGALASSGRLRRCGAAAAAAWDEPPGSLAALQRTQQCRSFGGSGSGAAGSGASSSSNAVITQTTTFLRNLHNGAEIFLVGTAHVSKQSAEEVREMIRLVRPSTVMLELCSGRLARLRSGGTSDAELLKSMMGTFAAPGGTMSQKVVQAGLPLVYRAMKALGMDPGAEFKAAVEEAERIGARIVCGDRDVQQTLQRLSQTVNFQDLMRMMTGRGLPDPPPGMAEFYARQSGSSIETKVEGMKTRAMVREMAEYLRQVNPRLAEVMIDERDQHMVDALARLEGRVVGVVGLAHLDGMERS
ncbi:conjugal transfer [Micractinium conductrix]|uniref:Conjugal transfer n=1 Tax=Micractinium conductrix TaxID=554055 RepID=A0A2P6VJR0_9CHLO|nr:conjugal transfer [Micractinium conductrix]|eukprot:PSC74329.1 conjugal transfer [Micractinium conductrix]